MVSQIVRVFGRNANQNDANQGKLIEVLRQMSIALDHINEHRDEDNTSRQALATSLKELTGAITLMQQTNRDQQRMVNETLSLLHASIEEFGQEFGGRFDRLAEDLTKVLEFIRQQPNHHEEIKRLLETILRAVQTAQQEAKTE